MEIISGTARRTRVRFSFSVNENNLAKEVFLKKVFLFFVYSVYFRMRVEARVKGKRIVTLEHTSYLHGNRILYKTERRTAAPMTLLIAKCLAVVVTKWISILN